MMRGHLLSKGIKIQEYRVRESMRRVDPDGIVIRALQLKVTHRRVYNVRGPLALWHMDGNHTLIRLEQLHYNTNLLIIKISVWVDV